VDDLLEELLDYCQCLPDSSSGRVWHTEAGRVVFVTNPRYYKIDGIGRANDRKQRGIRNPIAQQVEKEVRIGILEQELGLNRMLARRALGFEEKRKRLKEKSLRSKNKWNPPARRRASKAKSDTSDSADGSESLDGNSGSSDIS